MTGSLLFLYTETICHAGGPEASGAIDLPIQRAISSGAPVIWGSGVKGAAKDHARHTLQWDTERLIRVFGADPPRTTPGWATFTEARVAAFPVATLAHVFAWVTCPLALSGLARYARLAGMETPEIPDVVSADIIPGDLDRWSGRQGIGPFALDVTNDQEAAGKVAKWAEWFNTHALPDDAAFKHFRSKLATDLIVVRDDLYIEITREFAHVAPRVQLHTETKTVEQFFYEESLPTDTLLVALVAAAGKGWSAADVGEALHDQVFTVGGSETVGAGFVWSRVAPVPPTKPAAAAGGAEGA